MWMAIFSIMYGQKIHIVPVCNEELKTVPKIREKIFWGRYFMPWIQGIISRGRNVLP